MNELMIFENPAFGQVRTIEIDNKPWFVGRDVAKALGYGDDGKSATNAVARHVEDEDKGVSKMDTPGGKQEVTIINESGLYSLILSSKLPGAKEFKRWVTSEVIAYATKELSGKFLLPLPKLEEKTYSATEIGQLLGTTANRVGLPTNRYDLKTEQYGQWFKDKSRHSNKEVSSFRYFERVIPVLQDLLEQGAS